MIAEFYVPISGASPNIKFFDGDTQVGEITGYPAVETVLFTYQVDTFNDLDSYDLLRCTSESPNGVGWLNVNTGLVYIRETRETTNPWEESMTGSFPDGSAGDFLSNKVVRSGKPYRYINANTNAEATVEIEET